MAQLFRLNEKWPYPLKPSEYVQRQFHVQFQDDPVAVACRHITGLSTIVWGNDYPHAEGTFRGSRELIAAVRRRPRTTSAGHPRRHPRPPPRLRPRRWRPDGAAVRRDGPRSSPAQGADGAPTPACRPRAQRRGERPRRFDRGRGGRRRAGVEVAAEISPAVSLRSPTRAMSPRRTVPGTDRSRGRALRPHRRRDQQRRDHALGRACPRSTTTTWPPPGGARRRLVQHRPRRVAAHGRAGVRPDRDDDLDRPVRAAERTRRPTAKGGVVGLARSLAVAGAKHGIKVNLIAPRP